MMRVRNALSLLKDFMFLPLEFVFLVLSGIYNMKAMEDPFVSIRIIVIFLLVV